ncbi:MAG: pilus assembly protein [Bacilli bacterium]|nr:pilus assembly protein [Bacilli bacterium]
MKNNRGQALVEFVVILPIFLLLILSVIDFGNIISKKYSLENDIDTVSDMYEDGKYEEINSYIKEKDIKISYENDNEFTSINLSKDVNIISPMVNLIFGKTYEINVEKSIYVK